jgi:SAM-dependent methyltransferase
MTATINHWHDDRCARAFWDQRQALPYQDLLNDTARWLQPQAGERWLDLGCGGGQLTSRLWSLAEGSLERIVSSDVAAVNAEAIERLRTKLTPPPRPGQITFHQGDFSQGLRDFADGSFDGVVSGLAMSYAESRDPRTGAYTDTAFTQLLAELYRVLTPGGRLVFSINVPTPRFGKVVWETLRPGMRIAHGGRLFLNMIRMLWYGRWLNREAARGRFHYFELPELLTRLAQAGFCDAEHTLSYAGQAYVIRVWKPLVV